MSIENINNFIHFGCWNNLNKKGLLPNVMTSLNNYINNEQNIQLIVVSGDNYYPDKKKVDNDKKKKIIHVNKLMQGFSLLPKNIEIDMILGNHDLETDKTNEELFVNDNISESPEGGDCKITQFEKEASKQNLKINFNLFKSRKLTTNSLLLLIDTSMYSDDSEVQDFLPCYNTFLSEQLFNTIEDLKNYQNEFIYNTISENSNIKNLIIVGHHPITGFKFKKGKNKLMNDIPYFYNVLQKIYEMTSNFGTNYYYLCADYHSYQSGNVFLKFGENDNSLMEIKQYISGTGGTELDDELDNADQRLNKGVINKVDNNMDYEMNENIQKVGFLKCKIDESENFICEFQDTSTLMGGRKTKNKRSIKRISKYKNKKYNKKTYKRNKKNKTHKQKYFK